ncbi:synaptotagmin-15-like [Gigantopelta aegis]|uniref:synaptotagmin-15-like n=1 Tax=Gigantopelta aegis TaxID=1735272 RepID=UPI001B887EF2|nr:synaptotagmin-15-like [Gigantopelta aegis]
MGGKRNTPDVFSPHTHKVGNASLAAVIVGSLLSAVVVMAMTFMVFRYCRRKYKKSNSYEHIVGAKSFATDSGSIPATTISSLKQIPFTVPNHATPSGMRRGGDGVGRHQDEAVFGGGSEPTSPTGKRPSVEIPGAYALGSIDPSLYKISDEDDDYEIPQGHIGRIWFAVEYERETEKFLVTLIKAKNLPSRILGHDNGCDPFVRIYLMPDERRYLQSKFRKKTCNPKFEESYVFQVSYRTVEDRVLKLTVFDVDRHKRHNVIGHALYPLKEQNILLSDRVVVWRDLEKEVTETISDRGELLLSLTYNSHLERLTVGVFEGKCFHRADGSTSVDSYIKVTLMVQNKMVKSKKTEVAKKTSSPIFNESFTFKLPLGNVDTASINLSTMEHYSGHKDKLIGRIVLGSFMFARGKELDHWNEMVANQKEQVIHWHVLT